MVLVITGFQFPSLHQIEDCPNSNNRDGAYRDTYSQPSDRQYTSKRNLAGRVHVGELRISNSPVYAMEFDPSESSPAGMVDTVGSLILS